ncbi:hypothetical protein BC834DRAFT_972323 [Gloeopeniophorella convolvens]|nr:hypothetical protein BC834DRAFT_972323 [Gloeopeniophorella convolvens]
MSEGSRIPTPVTKTRGKISLKPALKSPAITSPMPVPEQGIYGSPTKSSPSRSLRSVRSMIGRKTPRIPPPVDAAPFDPGGSPVQNVTPVSTQSNHRSHERSRTDPGHTSRIPFRSPYAPNTSRVPPVSAFSTQGRTPRGMPFSTREVVVSDSSGSELHLQGERGRALFVTNAVIVPSSSSSSGENEVLLPSAPSGHPIWPLSASGRRHSRRQSGVGLGFGSPERMSNIPSRITHPANRDTADADAESEYSSDPEEDADHLAVSSSASITHLHSLIQNRQTLRPPDPGRQTSSSGELPNPWDTNSVMPDEGSQRRREELIELVNEMDRVSLEPEQIRGYDSSSDDEYFGERGLAISPSADIGSTYGGEGLEHHLGARQNRRLSPTRTHQINTRQTPRNSLTRDTDMRNETSSTSHRMRNAPARASDHGDHSPSEYTNDEDVRYNPDPEVSPLSQQRHHQNPQGRTYSPAEIPQADVHRSWTRESYIRTPFNEHTTPARLSSEHLESSGRGVSPNPTSERSRRTSREGTSVRSSKAQPSDAQGSIGNKLAARNRERKASRPSSPSKRDFYLPHADSASSIESLRWNNVEQDISAGAEAIFEQLSVGRQPASARASPTPPQRQTRRRSLPTDSSKEGGPSRDKKALESQRKANVPEVPAVASPHEEANPPPRPQRSQHGSRAQNAERRTWLSTLPLSAFHSLMDRYGEVEMERQQIIWDLSESEQAFVRRLQSFVRLFIQPLRMKDSVTWLAGVPPEVARLFDWLEDIINIHSQISSTLRATISEQYPIVMRIAGGVRSFVPRLEVHQPYVVRLESTALLIKRLVGEANGDFGDFIKLQQEQEECNGWNIDSFLVEPVNRLVDYPIHFKRLLDATPRGHPDHLSTFSLLHCTETMIRVMREVKLQEEEYELVKDRLSRIQGLPQSLQLAHRTRRLLARGRLMREHPPARSRTTTSGHGFYDHDRTQHHYAGPSSGVRQSRLIDAIRSGAVRSDSTKSTSSSAFSMESRLTDDLPPTPYTVDSSHPSIWEDKFTAPRSVRSSLRSSDGSKQVLYTLVFNDVVLLASPIRGSGNRHGSADQADSWCLLEGMGMSRILKATEDTGQIILDLLPLIDPEHVATGEIPDSGQVITLTLSVPTASSSGAPLDFTARTQLCQGWISAFRECAEYTLRALSFPTQSGRLFAPTPSAAWDDNLQTSISAILSSGLPFPKSPSVQLGETRADSAQQEREARGWWALRFQQVLREMQRGDATTLISVSPSTSMATRTSNSKQPAGARPRALKLSSLSSSESIVNRPPY